MIDNKPLFLFVGKSASGKTTIANMLEKQSNMNQVQSYTTRPQRFDGETGHKFVTDQEYDCLKHIVASSLYNEYKYCATLEQIKNADIYVIDINGMKELFDNYELIDRSIYVLYFDLNVYHRINRMKKRGHTNDQIIDRLLTDECFDWIAEIHNLTNCYYIIDAGKDIDSLYTDVISIVNDINN